MNQQGWSLLLGFASRASLASGLAIRATGHAAGRLFLCFALAATGAATDEGRHADERGAQDQGFDEFHLDLIGNVLSGGSRPGYPALTRCRICARV